VLIVAEAGGLSTCGNNRPKRRFRAGKVVQLGRLGTQFSVDLNNALNSSAIQAYNQTFIVNGAWLTPDA
jgi:hypothetical protein